MQVEIILKLAMLTIYIAGTIFIICFVLLEIEKYKERKNDE